MPKLREHDMVYTTAVALQATTDITHFLQTAWPQTVAVHNVEQDKAYQHYDVDLLWTVAERNGRLRIIPIEIKGDRLHKTGNFFFETTSNETKGTVGCFLYTRAEWIFYYFVTIGDLYCLPMDKVRPWFEAPYGRFPERRTSTPTANTPYVTVGRLVPIQIALAEVESILHFTRHHDQWTQIPNGPK